MSVVVVFHVALKQQYEAFVRLVANVMKLGAVVIPATTMLTEDDLRDRFDRGGVQHVIAAAELAGRFALIPGGYTRIAVGGAAGDAEAGPPGWVAFEDAYGAPDSFVNASHSSRRRAPRSM